MPPSILIKVTDWTNYNGHSKWTVFQTDLLESQLEIIFILGASLMMARRESPVLRCTIESSVNVHTLQSGPAESDSWPPRYWLPPLDKQY